MELVNQLQQLMQQGLGAVFRLLQTVWQWCITQVLAVPWDKLGEMPGSKVILLIASAGVVAYFLFRAAREIFAAGEKAFSAFVTLITVLVRTMPPILLAGVAAAVGAWVVNHMQM